MHPKDFKEKVWWYSFWWPQISQQTNFRILYWALNVEDGALSVASPLETKGLQKDAAMNARDRFVHLKWDYLKPMLDIITKYNYKKDEYSAIFDKRNTGGKDLGFGAGVSYDWVGGKLSEDEPIWRAARSYPDARATRVGAACSRKRTAAALMRDRSSSLPCSVF